MYAWPELEARETIQDTDRPVKVQLIEALAAEEL
jgi:hypothetical protein